MKAAIQCANKVTTVSPTYSKEILTPQYAHGLDGILKDYTYKLCGIINGIDTAVYDPETDKNLKANYSSADFSNKKINKTSLQKEMGLPEKEDTALIGIVSRLVQHKGLDLVKTAFEEMLERDVQFVILGSGDWEFETFFYEIAQKHPDKVAYKTGFIPSLARKIYAGADIFLMPSQSEPCGLAQMIALRYGTIPIVRSTGGLNDTITDSGDGVGNGFVFSDYTPCAMSNAVYRALEGYKNREGWNILVKRALECDNSWNISAGEYIKLYKDTVSTN